MQSTMYCEATQSPLWWPSLLMCSLVLCLSLLPCFVESSPFSSHLNSENAQELLSDPAHVVEVTALSLAWLCVCNSSLHLVATLKYFNKTRTNKGQCWRGWAIMGPLPLCFCLSIYQGYLLFSDMKIRTLPSPSKTSMGSNVQILECRLFVLKWQRVFLDAGEMGSLRWSGSLEHSEIL